MTLDVGVHLVTEALPQQAQEHFLEPLSALLDALLNALLATLLDELLSGGHDGFLADLLVLSVGQAAEVVRSLIPKASLK